ncbi:MAG: hypothetical protein AAB394_02700 [Patescibacteria group bacterium]
MAKYLAKNKQCIYNGDITRGVGEPCVVVDEDVKEIIDTERYLVKKERGGVEEVSGATLVPQR